MLPTQQRAWDMKMPAPNLIMGDRMGAGYDPTTSISICSLIQPLSPRRPPWSLPRTRCDLCNLHINFSAFLFIFCISLQFNLAAAK